MLWSQEYKPIRLASRRTRDRRSALRSGSKRAHRPRWATGQPQTCSSRTPSAKAECSNQADSLLSTKTTGFNMRCHQSSKCLKESYLRERVAQRSSKEKIWKIGGKYLWVHCSILSVISWLLVAYSTNFRYSNYNLILYFVDLHYELINLLHKHYELLFFDFSFGSRTSSWAQVTCQSIFISSLCSDIEVICQVLFVSNFNVHSHLKCMYYSSMMLRYLSCLLMQFLGSILLRVSQVLLKWVVLVQSRTIVIIIKLFV